VVDDTITTGITKVETIDKLRLLGEHKVVGMVIAVDRQEAMGDRDKVEPRSAVQYMEQELGVRIHSIQNIRSIYGLIKDSLTPELKTMWLDYYRRYGVVKLE
jgi:orotate phosphoribosyltransferase